ncbi:uncharacterized protein LOC143174242, partial [Nomia melanderi]|uniref:uncharacterized protein LOC143174242 n=1 Tax=Nomia melanderi TaxID=2448451 RepID=UPI003FCC6E5B
MEQGYIRVIGRLPRTTMSSMVSGVRMKPLTNENYDSWRIHAEALLIKDKLAAMDIIIHADMAAILLLYSLPSSYENFRCAIESCDELPSPDILKVKILEESEARYKSNVIDSPGAFAVDNRH